MLRNFKTYDGLVILSVVILIGLLFFIACLGNERSEPCVKLHTEGATTERTVDKATVVPTAVSTVLNDSDIGIDDFVKYLSIKQCDNIQEINKHNVKNFTKQIVKYVGTEKMPAEVKVLSASEEMTLDENTVRMLYNYLSDYERVLTETPEITIEPLVVKVKGDVVETNKPEIAVNLADKVTWKFTLTPTVELKSKYILPASLLLTVGYYIDCSEYENDYTVGIHWRFFKDLFGFDNIGMGADLTISFIGFSLDYSITDTISCGMGGGYGWDNNFVLYGGINLRL